MTCGLTLGRRPFLNIINRNGTALGLSAMFVSREFWQPLSTFASDGIFVLAALGTPRLNYGTAEGSVLSLASRIVRFPSTSIGRFG